ncbi:farnesol dehydrogenase-like [Chrysoperla carnea]|uniref:farnesol dehydrogenase-like n=1 Tax=Chrysoperla carnea TaxID=189513 RepID=UPI001D085C58|nr:farnesol dehydrogenase-like [Chrysoperla carnea]
MDKWANKVVVVTGASSGIGYGIAKRLTKYGLQVIGLARRVERIQKLASELANESGKLHPIKCDITNDNQVTEIFNNIKKQFGGIDVLINNAGCVTKNETLLEGSMEVHRNLIETNILALTHCTQLAVKSMIERNIYGQVINLNSIYGHIIPIAKPIPNLYPASKFAVTAISETLRQELYFLNNTKIKVASLSPGYVDTEIVRTEEGEVNPFLADLEFLNVDDIVEGVVFILSLPNHVQVNELTLRHVGEKF